MLYNSRIRSKKWPNLRSLQATALICFCLLGASWLASCEKQSAPGTKDTTASTSQQQGSSTTTPAQASGKAKEENNPHADQATAQDGVTQSTQSKLEETGTTTVADGNKTSDPVNHNPIHYDTEVVVSNNGTSPAKAHSMMSSTHKQIQSVGVIHH